MMHGGAILRREAVELTIVAPCFNERANVGPLVERLSAALQGVEWEIIFVDDDSPDGTSDEIRGVAQSDRRVRVLQRIGRRGLSSAVIEGLLASSAPYLAVIDADMQHDETILPRMLAAMKSERLDIVIGSRFTDGGSVGNFEKRRQSMSNLATWASRLVLKQDVKDPMSGFFLVTRAAFDESVRRLSGQGFKILLDLFASAPRPLRFREVGYTFRERTAGETKLDSVVLFEYGTLLLDKVFGGAIPPRFALFAAIGASGVVTHLVVLRMMMGWFGFTGANAIAAISAMTTNFFLNNLLTYSDQRLRGGKLLKGLLSFYAVCSVGAIANVGIASTVFRNDYSWWLSAIAGILVGVVWNYAMSSTFTWKPKR